MNSDKQDLYIFNIINSYYNQRDTIWNDIKYLKYFYHLFPIHVNKFYWLFNRYVNPKIEVLKESINELYSKKDSISGEITNLGETKKTIEKLSTQITEDIEEINESIGRTNRFDSFASTLKNQISEKLQEIQSMDKTSEITVALNAIVQKIANESKQKLEEINKRIQEHEQYFKEKICNQIEQIKSLLQQLVNGTGGNIKILEDKIEEFVRTGTGGSGNYGSLRKLTYRMYRFREDSQQYLSDNRYLKQRLRTLNLIPNSVEPTFREFLKQIDQNREYINVTVKALKEINVKLGKDKKNIGVVLSGLSGWTNSDITGCEPKIGEQKSKMKSLEILSNLGTKYSESLKNARKAIRFVEKFKTLLNGWKGILSRPFTSHVNDIPEMKEEELQEIKTLLKVINGLVKNMPQVKERELNEIVTNLKEIKSLAKTAQRHLRNTQRMFEYLTSFKEQEKKISGLSINGTRLEQIQETIKGAEHANKTIKQANDAIKEAKQTLENGLKEDSIQGGPGGQGNGENDNMMPKELDLNGKESGFQKFEEYKVKLTAIQEFNSTLDGITPGMSSLNGTNQQSNGSGVDSVLSWLRTIDETLSAVYKSINSTVLAMKITYESKWNDINGSHSVNGSSIKSHVDKIKEIPSKIAELQSKVKYNIVLLNIAKSVNETLNNVKVEAEKLKGIGENLMDSQHYTGFMKKG